MCAISGRPWPWKATPEPSAPVRLDKDDGAFANIWARLDRLADYDPLVRLTFEQSLYDFHPPVRLHDDERMAETLYFPGDIAYIDPSDSGPGKGWFDEYVEGLYRLDGTIQLRRSRFLHVDLDLEYRLDGPAWELVYPAALPESLPLGFEWLTEPEGRSAAFEPDARESMNGQTAIDSRDGYTGFPDLSGSSTAPSPVQGVEAFEPVPFQLHRLDQSRQIRSNTMQYFDSAFLGAIVRVTPIADEAP